MRFSQNSQSTLIVNVSQRRLNSARLSCGLITMASLLISRSTVYRPLYCPVLSDLADITQGTSRNFWPFYFCRRACSHTKKPTGLRSGLFRGKFISSTNSRTYRSTNGRVKCKWWIILIY